MKAYDYDAVTYDGQVYCTECLPEEAREVEVMPIFASEEWEHPGATCDACGHTHDYMAVYGVPEDDEGEEDSDGPEEGNS